MLFFIADICYCLFEGKAEISMDLTHHYGITHPEIHEKCVRQPTLHHKCLE